jgi:hypothetical protein
LKNDPGADGFCLKEFFTTEAAFQAVCCCSICYPSSNERLARPGCPPAGELGRAENQNSLARQSLGLANPNFAEVGFRSPNLTLFRNATTDQNLLKKSLVFHHPNSKKA